MTHLCLLWSRKDEQLVLAVREVLRSKTSWRTITDCFAQSWMWWPFLSRISFKCLVEWSVSSVFLIVFISLSQWMKWSLVAILEWMLTMNDQRQLSKNPSTLNNKPVSLQQPILKQLNTLYLDWIAMIKRLISDWLASVNQSDETIWFAYNGW